MAIVQRLLRYGAAVRDSLLGGAFLSRERMRLWSLALIAATLLAAAWLGFTANGLSDYRGRPLGTDFACLYTAGEMARHGEAVYDPAGFFRAQQAIFGPSTTRYGWFYPPQFLFVAEALSLLPYIPALLVWLGLTGLAYLAALRALLRNTPGLTRDPLWLLATLAFPAVLVNLGHGQNGFLTAALMAGGLAFLKPRPLLAGILFALLAYKPQFCLALPFALLAGRQWKTVAAAVVTALVLAAVATAVFGIDVWRDFFAASQLSRLVVIEQGDIGFEKMQSVFAAVRLLGGPVGLAYAVQGAVSVGALAVLVKIWRSPAPDAVKGAVLCLVTVLATPYSVDYDLVVLAPAIALLASDGLARGFNRGDHLVLAILWFLPVVARTIGGTTHLGLMPLAVMAGLVIAWRRQEILNASK